MLKDFFLISKLSKIAPSAALPTSIVMQNISVKLSELVRFRNIEVKQTVIQFFTRLLHSFVTGKITFMNLSFLICGGNRIIFTSLNLCKN